MTLCILLTLYSKHDIVHIVQIITPQYLSGAGVQGGREEQDTAPQSERPVGARHMLQKGEILNRGEGLARHGLPYRLTSSPQSHATMGSHRA